MQATLRRGHRSKKSAPALLITIAAPGLCAFQFGDRNELNKMPFTQLQQPVSDLPKARRMAKQGNIDLLVGQAELGEAASLRGEVTDVNCYRGSHLHACNHAFGAQLCAAPGGAWVFIPDRVERFILCSTNGRAHGCRTTLSRQHRCSWDGP